jgi:hypothetical protein
MSKISNLNYLEFEQTLIKKKCLKHLQIKAISIVEKFVIRFDYFFV